VYLYASEICMDWIDQDCDGFADSLMRLYDDEKLGRGNDNWPSVAWSGSQFGVVYQVSGSPISLALIDDAGNRLSSLMSVELFGANPEMVWTGSRFFVVWEDPLYGESEISVASVHGDGYTVEAFERVTEAGGYSQRPDLVWTGSEVGVAWQDERGPTTDVYFTRLDPAGTKIGSDLQISNVVTGMGTRPAIGWSGSTYGLFWEDDGGGNKIIVLQVLDGVGTTVSSQIVVSDPMHTAMHPDLTWNGSAYGLVWIDAHAGNSDVIFKLVADDGSFLSSDVRIVDGSTDSQLPSIEWMDGAFAIGWLAGGASGVLMAVVEPDGTTRYQDTFSGTWLSVQGSPMGLSWSGSRLGVTWREDDNSDMLTDFFFNAMQFCE